jgi:hypothetical protein
VLLPLADLDVAGPAKWVAPREGRAGSFLSGLGIQRFSWDELAVVLDTVDAAEGIVFDDNGESRKMERAEHAIWVRWLMSKNDEDLRAFRLAAVSGDDRALAWFQEVADADVHRAVHCVPG